MFGLCGFVTMVHYKASGIIPCVVVVRHKLESTEQAVGQIGRCCFLERRMGVVHKSV